MATQLIAQKIGKVENRSSVYETLPWGVEDQPIFYNLVLQQSTSFAPDELLATTQSIEQMMGRKKHRHWGERLIDIDILYLDDLVYETEHLNIPHIQIPNRRFTLIPLVEIAPDLKHPVLTLSQTQLLDQCTDQLEVKKVIL